MSLAMTTIDCTVASDSDLAEMAELTSDAKFGFSAGFLSKQAESWILLTRVREKGNLKGFSFHTLDRIGGTPCIIMGATYIEAIPKRSSIQKQIVTEQLKKALMAFPDEDVLVGARLIDFSGLELLDGFVDLNPHPSHKSNGEERAWGRRLAGKYGVGSADYDPSTSIVKGNGDLVPVVLHQSLKQDKLDGSMKKLFKNLNQDKLDSLIVHGWAKANYLQKRASK